jgi:hypothetical protein
VVHDEFNKNIALYAPDCFKEKKYGYKRRFLECQHSLGT